MQNNNQRELTGAIILVGILVAGAILLKDSKPPERPVGRDNSPSTTWQGRPVSADDHIRGNRNAKIVIVEYSDLECPFCRIFHSTMQKVVENHAEVAWIYRHYPIASLHPKALREAEATECAWEQGENEAFWKYTDRIFAITPSNNGLKDAELFNVASFIGLDVDMFRACLESGKYREKVEADIDDGVKAGVNGTPSSFILVNGKLKDTIGGAQPYEVVAQKINQSK